MTTKQNKEYFKLHPVTGRPTMKTKLMSGIGINNQHFSWDKEYYSDKHDDPSKLWMNYKEHTKLTTKT